MEISIHPFFLLGHGASPLRMFLQIPFSSVMKNHFGKTVISVMVVMTHNP